MIDTTKGANSNNMNPNKLGKKGGIAAQPSEMTHQLTHDEKSKGGHDGPTNFANRQPDKVQDIAKK